MTARNSEHMSDSNMVSTYIFLKSIFHYDYWSNTSDDAIITRMLQFPK